MKPAARERGRSMAWTAILFMTVLVPLLMLVVDGSRLYRVRTRLQTAVDAGCEDAAWSAADRNRFMETGEVTFTHNWQVWSVAHTTFQNTLADQGLKQYAAVMHVFPDRNRALVACDAYARVPLLIAGGTRQVTASTVSQIRFSR